MKKKIPVDGNIPMPPRSVYPWDTMEVGDSFPVYDREQKNVASQCSQAGKRLGRKFTTRKMAKNGTQYTRVFREN